MRLTLGSAAFWLTTIVCAGSACAQSFPSKPIRFMIGFTPGALTDGVARVVGIEMEKRLGQPVILEFRPGANGTIAAKYVATSNPDGYTLFFGSTLPMHPIFTLNNSVDAEKELAAVSRTATQPFYFMSNSKLPVNSYQELLAFGKANPGRLTQGSSTALQDLIMGILKDRTGLETRSIPFKGSPQVAAALLAGDVDVTIGGVLAYLPHVQAGKVRLLFVASRERSSGLRDVPSAVEAGIPNFEAGLDYGLWAPVGMPREILLKLGTEAAIATKVPAVLERMQTFSAEPVGSSPDEAARTFASVMKFWKEATRVAGFKPQ